MKLPSRQFRSCLPSCGWLLVSLLFTGCSHLYYADPNPASPYVFPGQSSTPPALTQTSLTSPAPAFAPVGTPPISTSLPAVPPADSVPTLTAAAGAVPTPLPNLRLNTVSDILSVGEAVTVSFADIPPPGILPITQRIGNDGQITLPFNVKIMAAGRTSSQVQDEIRRAYVPKYFVQCTPSVASEERVFFVEGEVKQPSRLPYKGQMTVLRAITSAGGFTDFAQRKKVRLQRATGQKFIINWNKASQDPKLDLPVYPNDLITVPKSL